MIIVLVGSWTVIIALAKCAKDQLKLTNDAYKNEGGALELKEMFGTFIGMHADAKQLSSYWY